MIHHNLLLNHFSLLFFDGDYADEPEDVEQAADALKSIELSEETKKKAEESLQNLLDLGGDEDDELILDIDTQLTEKDLQLLPTLSGMKKKTDLDSIRGLYKNDVII